MANSKFINVAICTPVRDVVDREFANNLALLTACFANTVPEGVEAGIGLFDQVGSVLPEQRTRLVLNVLNTKSKPFTHILFLDSDMTFPHDTIARLLKHDKDIIATNCPTKELPARTTAADFNKQLIDSKGKEGIEKVRQIGTAVMLIKTDVFKNLSLPWFAFPFKHTGKKWNEIKSEYDTMFYGEDIYFCGHAQDNGYDVWCDHDLSKEIGHVGQLKYTHDLVKYDVQ